MTSKLNTFKKINFDTSFNLFNNLSNELRYKMLVNLLKEKSSIAKISKKENHSSQIILGHLKKLEISGLIKKDPNGSYLVTPYGKLILIKTSSFEFITKHKTFFKEHTFGETPPSLLNRIGLLSKAEFVDGAVANFERWKKIIENANKFFYGIFTQTPHRTDVSLSKIFEKGLKIKLIFGKNGIMSNYAEIAQKLHFDNTTSQETIGRRMTDSVLVNVMITDSHACLMFPDRKNRTDASRTFISTDTDFRQWCLDFFYHKWNDAEPFSRFRNFG